MTGRLARLRVVYREHLLFREITNRRQKALATIVYRILVRANYKPVPHDVFRDGVEGFHVSVHPRFNGTASVSVGHSPDFDEVTARRYAHTLVNELSAVIGGQGAKRLVQVKLRSVPLKGQGVTDDNGLLMDHLDYVDVTIALPVDEDLKKLYATFGRR